jgi:hypothetical protein
MDIIEQTPLEKIFASLIAENVLATNKSQKLDTTIESLWAGEDVPVDSSWIYGVKYNPQLKAMTIELEDATYTYFNVSQELYDSFLASPSKGTFINNRIKKGFFPFVRG